MFYPNTLSQNAALNITLESGVSDRSWDVYRNEHRIGSIFYGFDALWYNSGNRIGYANREDAIAAVLSHPKPLCESVIVDGVIVPF